jgi:hypothetical protein
METAKFTGRSVIFEIPATLKDSLTTDEINSMVKYPDGLPAGDATAEIAPAAAQSPTTGVDLVRDPTDLTSRSGRNRCCFSEEARRTGNSPDCFHS